MSDNEFRPGKATSEVVKEHYRKAHEEKAEGRPIAWLTGNAPVEIFYAFGVRAMFPESYATMCAARGCGTMLCELAEEDGWGRDMCSFLKSNIGFLKLREQNRSHELPNGGLPAPDVLMVSRVVCNVQVLWWQYLSKYFNVPLFILDVPYNMGRSKENLPQEWIHRYSVGMHDLIAFLENALHTKLDYDRLRQVLSFSGQAGELWEEMQELRKTVPSPMSSREAIGIMYPLVGMAGAPETAELYKKVVAEIRRRVDQKVPAVKNEKYRLLLEGIPLWYKLDMLKYVENAGMVFATSMYSGRWPAGPMNPEKPFESLARKYISARTNSSIERRAEMLSELADQYKIDGAVYYSSNSCRVNLIGQISLKNHLQKKYGVPGLLIESDMVDDRTYADGPTMNRVDAFIEMVQSKKPRGLE